MRFTHVLRTSTRFIAVLALLATVAAYPIFLDLTIAADAALLGVASVLLGATLLVERERSLTIPLFAFVPIALLCSAITSYLLSSEGTYVVFGTVSEMGTIASYGLIFLASLLAVHMPGSMARFALTAVLLVALITAFAFGVRPMLSEDTDVRPSFAATASVSAPVFLASVEDALIGKGPKTFPHTWTFYRSSSFNQGNLWATVPRVGYSTASTIASELGLLGLFAFLLVPLCVLMSLFQRRQTLESMVLAAVVLVIYAASVMYPIELPMILVAAMAFGWYLRSSHDTTDMLAAATYQTFAVGALLVCGGILFTWVGAWQSVGAYSELRATSASERGSKTEALSWYERAAHSWRSAEYLHDASRAVAEEILTFPSTPLTLARPELRNNIEQALTYVNEALRRNATDYRLWLYRASLYVTLHRFGYEGALNNAAEDLAQAGRRAPTNPSVHYVRALLSSEQGDRAGAVQHLTQALKLKSDYQDARVFLERILAQ